MIRVGDGVMVVAGDEWVVVVIEGIG